MVFFQHERLSSKKVNFIYHCISVCRCQLKYLLRIASIVGYTSVDQFDKYPSQISEPIYLEKGQKCYLKAIAKEHGGGDFAQVQRHLRLHSLRSLFLTGTFQVAVLVHDTPHEYKSSQTKDSIHEKQRLIVQTEFFHEVHAIHITEYNGGDGTLTLTWDGYQSDPIALPSTNEDGESPKRTRATGSHHVFLLFCSQRCCVEFVHRSVQRP